MLAGIFYGSQYGGAIGAILLNLPCHPPHAVTCLDGYPLTKQGKGGTALGLTMIGVVLRRLVRHHGDDLLRAAAGRDRVQVRPGRDLLGHAARPARRLDPGAGSPLKGVAMTLLGLLVGVVGTDVNSGVQRFTFGIPELVRRRRAGRAGARPVRHRRLPAQRQPHRRRRQRRQGRAARHAAERAELKQAFLPMVRGT